MWTSNGKITDSVKYVTALEMSSPSRRTKIALYQFLGFTFGHCTMSLIAWATGGDWQLFMVLTSLPCAALFLAFRSVPSTHKTGKTVHKKSKQSSITL
jgi:hypothetical protein